VRVADPAGGDAVTVLGVVGGVVQPVLIVAGSPLLVGVMRQVRARLEGRAGPGVLQPWRDLRKLFGKERIIPRGTSEVFRVAPLVLVATSLVVAVVVPFVTTDSAIDPVADLYAVVALLALGAVALALAGIDTGTAFGGMGASREMTILALVEPTLLVAIFALSARVGSTNLGAIVSSTLHDPARVISPASLLAVVALVVVIVAETGRLPVDNPSTHLELTMVHEAMVLEYAGPDLALVELASAMRLSVFLGLLANLFVPWGIATAAAPAALLVGVLALVVKVGLLGVLLAAGEVFLAKLRLFRVPELLAGSFLLALLAVAVSFFLA
jgi:formate hydrogenlyase subunit 4